MRLFAYIALFLLITGTILSIVQGLVSAARRMTSDPETGGVARGFLRLIASAVLAAGAALVFWPITNGHLTYGTTMAILLPVTWLAARGLWR